MNKSMTFALRAMTISAAVAVGFGTSVASAAALSTLQPVSEGVQRYVVRFADLDLSKTAGVAALYARLGHAARLVCGVADSREMGIAAINRACIAQAVANAVTGVNSPLLSQYHQLHTKGDKAAPVQLAKAD